VTGVARSRPVGRPLVTSAVALAVACAGLVACGPDAAHRGAGGGISTARATDFVLKGPDGRSLTLSDYLGRKVILLNLYATWCTACEVKLTHLERLHQTYRDRGLLVLGISMDGPETIAMVGPQARRVGVTFPVLLDEESGVTAIYNPQRTAPFSVLIDREGRIRWVRPGYLSGDEVMYERNIKALLAGGTVPMSEGR
jgi:peroxiredoxin